MTASNTLSRARWVMLHDYPPVSGGGLALSAADLAACLPDGIDCPILSARLVDHFADDRASVTPARGPATPRSVLRAIRAADLVIVHWTFSFRRLSTLTAIGAPLAGKRVVCVIHTAPAHCRFNRLQHWPSAARQVLMRAMGTVFGRCEATVALTNGHARALAQVGIRATHVLPLPVHASDESYNETYHRHQASDRRLRRIGIAGELSTLKGTEAIPGLLRALTPEIQFHIVGDGPLRPFIERSIGTLPESQRRAVSFKGRLAPDEMAGFYSDVDFLLVPSWTETHSRVVVEAMLAGVVVLTRPVEGLTDLIIDGQTGYYVEPEDSGSVAIAVRRLADVTTEAYKLRSQAHLHVRNINACSIDGWVQLLTAASQHTTRAGGASHQ